MRSEPNVEAPRARWLSLPAGPDQAEARRTMLGGQIPAIRMVSASGSVASGSVVRGVVDGVATEALGWSGRRRSIRAEAGRRGSGNGRG
jgi:hypothetical protein